jgi:hypothetical protein
MKAKGPPLPVDPVPGHDRIVGDGAIDPPNPLRPDPAAPWANPPAGGGAASVAGARPFPAITNREMTASAITIVITSSRLGERSAAMRLDGVVFTWCPDLSVDVSPGSGRRGRHLGTDASVTVLVATVPRRRHASIGRSAVGANNLTQRVSQRWELVPELGRSEIATAPTSR